MTSAKNTKKALLLSILSLVLCFSMLIGTTFAWFTDSVTSANNIIKSGNLDIELEYWNGAEWVDVAGKSDILTNTLWEPGVTEIAYLRVVNAGSLAFKYQLGINVVSETKGVNRAGEPFLLSDYIQFGVVEDITTDATTKAPTTYADREAAVAAVENAKKISAGYTKAASMIAGQELYLALVLWMPTTVGNEANHDGKNVPEINLGINVVASQVTNEYDSFGNDYDAMADGYYHVNYGFNNPADLLAFAPTPGDAASSGLSLTDDGKARINASGAWYTIDADLGKHEYVVAYDIDITNMAVGENVTVDAGETVGWGSTPIMLERGSTKVYYGNSKNAYLGELEGTVVHVMHVFKYNSDNKLEITTTVSDGNASVSYTAAVASAAKTELYWDIYYATEAGKATMDNFSVKSADAVVDTASELSGSLAEGGKVVLTTDIDNFEGANISKDTLLDLNGKNVSGEKGIVVANGAKLNVANGTMEIASADGDAITVTNDEEGTTSTLDLSNVQIDLADVGDANKNNIVVDATAGNAVLNIDKGTVINAAGEWVAAIKAVNNAEVNVNGGEINVENKSGSGVFGISVEAAGAVVNVTGGVFHITGNQSASGIVTWGEDAIVNISGGTFNVETSGGYGIAVEVYDGQVNATGGVFNIKATGGAGAYAFALSGNLDLNVDSGVIINVWNDLYSKNDAYDGKDSNPAGCNAVINLMTEVPGYHALYTDGTNYYAYDAEGLISMRNFWKANWCGNNMWNRSYNIINDIDATGYTWDNVWVNVGNNDNNGFVFDGHGHTVTGLIIKDGLFSGTPNGGNKPNNPGYVQNITFDGVKVVGDHWAGILWSNVYNELVVKNVSVINSTITGKCNVAALVGGTVIDGASDASVEFINCVVKNNVITGEGKNGQDPNGANVYVGRVYGNTAITFENCVSKGNTVINNNGLVGGGIYGYTIWANGDWAGTGTCDSFTSWNGLTVVTENTHAGLSSAVAMGGTVALNGTVDLGGTAGSYLVMNQDVTIQGGTIKGTGWTGELNYGVNATAGNIVFDGVTFDTTDWSTVGWAKWGISVNVNGTANVTFKNCTFKGSQCPIYQSGATSVITLENCKFETAGVAIQCEIYSGDFSLGQNLIVKNCDFTGLSDVLHIYDYDKDPSTEAIVKYLTDNGNIFTGVCKQTCQ